MKYDFSVFIGRFQPFHIGHYSVVKEALKQSKKLIFVIGSSGGARTTRNPLTFDERVSIILSSLSAEENKRVEFTAVPDFMYNDNQWIASVQQAVFSVTRQYPGCKIALAGMSKDESSYYLNLFPQWDSISVKVPENVVSSTAIRNEYFSTGKVDCEHFVNSRVGTVTTSILDKFRDELINDWRYEAEYEEKWGKGPHFTADACVVQSGYVLLIQRGAEYGHKKWALPGGFVNSKEKALDASIRELFEETHIKVPEKVIRGSVVKSELFDNPYRSNRSRIITQATYFQLSNMELPKVSGNDDAQDARWFPLSQVKSMRDALFEDHYDIISSLTGVF